MAGDLDNIILMAMRKDPARRYASAAQFAEDIQRHLDGRAVMARGDGSLYRTGKLVRRNRRLLGAIAGSACALALLFVGLGWWRDYTARLESSVPPRIYPFTSFPGNEEQPAFSPDGSKIAFVWDGEDSRNPDIYVRALSGGDLLRLTTDNAEDLSPAWSPDGQRIAFVRRTRGEAALYVTPALASAETKVADLYPNRLETVGRHLDWSPDGRFLAAVNKHSPNEPFSIYLISLADGTERRLTNPPTGTVGDSDPAFSPDGKNISFIRAPSSGVTDVFVIPVAGGQERRLTSDNRWIVSQTWTPDGRTIVFSSNRTGGQNLWKIGAIGRRGSAVPERMAGIGENASGPSFSRKGQRMVYAQFSEDTNVWQLTLGPGHSARELSSLIASTQYDSSPQYSPDGRKVAIRSSRSGNHEIWVADSDGKNPFQLTNFGGPLTGTPRWSPDGLWVAFDSRPEGQPDIFVIASEGGAPRRLTYEVSEDVVPSWSRDGRWVYFASNRGGSWQVWKTPFNGGQKIQVTREGGFAAFESPDGKYLYYAKGRSLPGLWRVPLQGGEEKPIIPDLKPGYWGYWAVARDGIYFADGPPGTAQPGIYFLDFASGNRSLVSPVKKPFAVADSAFALSPDERRILYTQIDQSGSDVIIADYSGQGPE